MEINKTTTAMNNPIFDKLTGAHKNASNPDHTEVAEEKPPRKKRKHKTPEEKLAELQEKQSKIAARVKDQKAKLKQDERKRDTRRKIVAGAIALEHMEHDENFRHVMEGLLKRYVTEKDLELFEFHE